MNDTRWLNFLEMGANLWCCDPTILAIEPDSGLAVCVVDGHASRRIPDSDGYIRWRGCWMEVER